MGFYIKLDKSSFLLHNKRDWDSTGALADGHFLWRLGINCFVSVREGTEGLLNALGGLDVFGFKVKQQVAQP